MYKIKTLNSISDIVNERLCSENYAISSDAENYDAVLVRSADMHGMSHPSELLAIARAGAGTNNIPIEECSDAGIVVFNTPGANANAVKELVLCGMLLAGRRVVPGIQWVSKQVADGVTGLEKLVEKGKGEFVGPELAGKKLGVIGLGAIGVLVANAGVSMQMDVLGYDPFMSVEAAWRLRRAVKQAKSLSEIFATCDYISLHLPLNDKTKKTVGEAELASMKPGAVLLNFARGALADDDAVLKSLDNGHLRHYVTDFPNEKVAGHPRVIAIPHLGASTPESEENCAVMAADRLRAYLEDGEIKDSVNFPDCSLSKNGGYRLAVINRNVTNMVGQITTLLAGEGNNIDNMINKSRGAWAYTLLDLSSIPTQASLDAIGAIDGVVRVRLLKQ